MKSRRFVALLTLLTCAGGLMAAAAVQDKKPAAPAKEKPAAAPAQSPEDAQMQAKWMAFMTPGAEHKLLDSRVGKWSGKVQIWMAAGAPAMESTCTSEFAWVMGGRYLENTTHGNFMGQPFEGKGVTGFDNLKKKYVSSWIDNTGTGIMSMEGSYDAAAKTFTYDTTAPDFIAGKYTPAKGIERMVDANTFVMEMQGTDPKTGKMFKSMEITYSRAK